MSPLGKNGCREIAQDLIELLPASIAEDADVVAFEDLNPQAPTHVLVIPRKHIPTLNDLAAEDDVVALARVSLERARGDLALASAPLPEGGFREDLYFRLNVFHIHLPPLREHKEDLPLLVEYLLRDINEKHGRKVRGVNSEVMDGFQSHTWPGNIRELRNLIERLMIMVPGPVIDEAQAAMALQEGIRTGELPKGLNILGVCVGAVGIITIIPALNALVGVFGLGQIIWFVWLGIVLLSSDQSRTA